MREGSEGRGRRERNGDFGVNDGQRKGSEEVNA